MGLIESFYQSAARAGFLVRCRWMNSPLPIETWVNFKAVDEAVLNGLTLSTETTITFPASSLHGIAAGAVVEIRGDHYQVREVRSLGDGSERKATLTKLDGV
ncbi:Head-tail adaptor protein [Gammaproteobacteria bacterium]